MKFIKSMIWFLSESRSFMNLPLWKIIFCEQGVKKAFGFARDIREWDRVAKIHGNLGAYLRLNRVIEM